MPTTNPTSAPATTAAVENAAVVIDNEVVATTSAASAVEEMNTRKSQSDIIKDIIRNGGKRYNSCRIRNVKIDDENLDETGYNESDESVRVTLVIDRDIPAFILQEDGTYKEGVSNNIFTSNYAISGMFKEDDELAFVANEIVRRPKILNLLLCGATCDILQQEVRTGDDGIARYRNPFSTRIDADDYETDHDMFINNVIKVKLNKQGLRMLDRIADKMLGF